MPRCNGPFKNQNEKKSKLTPSDWSKYRISSYSFCGNYSFLNLEIQRSQYINVRKLFKGRNYSRAEIRYLVDVLHQTFE